METPTPEKRGNLKRWTRSSAEWQEQKRFARDRETDPLEAARKMRATVQKKFGSDSPQSVGLDELLGFMARMPETAIGANPYYFVRSKCSSYPAEDPRDPTEVVVNVDVFRKMFELFYPDRLKKLESVENMPSWLELLEFRALSPRNPHIPFANSSVPMMCPLFQTLVRKELALPVGKDQTLGPRSFAHLRFGLFRAWRELAVSLGLDQRFERCEIYDRVWTSSVKEFETRFAVPLPHKTWESRRPSFLGVPGFSADSTAPGILDETFWRGCLFSNMPPYQLQVAGTLPCLFPALFLEDFEDQEDEMSLMRQISARSWVEDQDDQDEANAVQVPREPPLVVDEEYDYESSEVRSLLRPTNARFSPICAVSTAPAVSTPLPLATESEASDQDLSD